MRRKRECYLLIREIRVARRELSWMGAAGAVDGKTLIMCGVRGHGVGRI
jgi:hypothetical protein